MQDRGVVMPPTGWSQFGLMVANTTAGITTGSIGRPNQPYSQLENVLGRWLTP
jgi:hypothetical protein